MRPWYQQSFQIFLCEPCRIVCTIKSLLSILGNLSWPLSCKGALFLPTTKPIQRVVSLGPAFDQELTYQMYSEAPREAARSGISAAHESPPTGILKTGSLIDLSYAWGSEVCMQGCPFSSSCSLCILESLDRSNAVNGTYMLWPINVLHQTLISRNHLWELKSNKDITTQHS